MAKYRVLVLERGRVPDRDARFVSVSVDPDGEYLGQFETQISGLEMMIYERLKPVTRAQLWSLAAMEMGRALQRQAEEGTLRKEWKLDIEMIPIDFDGLLGRASQQLRPVPDFAEGIVVKEFTAP